MMRERDIPGYLGDGAGKWHIYLLGADLGLVGIFFFFFNDCKEIQLVHFKGDQSWVFFGRNDAEAESPVFWPPHVKS